MPFRRFSRTLKALESPVHAGTLALLQALIVGLLVGVVIVLFRETTAGIRIWRKALGLHPQLWWQWGMLPLIGFVGGAIAGHLTEWAPDAKGSGIPQLKHSLVAPSRPTLLRTVWVKFLGASVAIGSGLSLGREGPSVQIGGGIGEWVSRWFPRSRQDRRRLMAAGAAAGLAAAFNAPFAGFVFSVEELLKNFSARSMSTVILATVTASMVSHAFAGDVYTYRIPATSFHLRELPCYLLLGILAGGLGALFIHGVLASQDLYQRLSFIPRAWRPALAGLLTGMVGWWLPSVLGGGHGLAESAFHAQLLGWTVLVLFLAKFALTLLACGSGAPGGIFAPSLVLGAVLGAGVGQVSNLFTGGDATAIASFAFVGMGALFTAIARTPITAIVIVPELTGNYHQVLPLMLACMTAHAVATLLKEGSIYDALLAREGTFLSEGTLPEELGILTVDDVMTQAVECLDASQPIADARRRFLESGHGGFPVCEGDRLVGILTRSDLLGVPADASLTSAMTSSPIVVSREAPLGRAWELFSEHEVGRLVVVDAADATHPVGILTRSDLLHGAKRSLASGLKF
ncbi:MAG: chloride channel protein [Bacteroidota bacterium]